MSWPILYISVPITALRPFEARDYQESYPVPPPSTMFGLLLSLTGVPREQAHEHAGVRLAIGVNHPRPISTVVRKMRRDPASAKRGAPPQFRPEYQELLTDLKIWCMIAPPAEQESCALLERIQLALDSPAQISRFGALSLGESAFLVDEVSWASSPPERCAVLTPAAHGFYKLPVWVDHADRTQTRQARFELVDGKLTEDTLVSISPLS